jgi:predicted peptidase
VVFALCTVTLSAAEEILGFEAYRYTPPDSSGASLPYRLFTPSPYSPSRVYPLVIYLHGAGQRGDDNQRHILEFNDLITLFTSAEIQAEHPHFILAPQCPRDSQWVNISWSTGSYSLDQVPVSRELTAVKGLYDHLCSVYAIDTNRVYVAGGSIGGYGCWDIVMRYTRLFAAAIPMCGGGDPSRAADIKNVAFWIWHGSNDPVVPVQASREMYAALRSVSCTELKYNEPAYGHFVWEAAVAEPGLAGWLFSQTRSSHITAASKPTAPPVHVHPTTFFLDLRGRVLGETRGVCIDGATGHRQGIIRQRPVPGHVHYQEYH